MRGMSAYGDFTFSSGYELVKDLFNCCDMDALFRGE
jgi:hypothetical protein